MTLTNLSASSCSTLLMEVLQSYTHSGLMKRKQLYLDENMKSGIEGEMEWQLVKSI